MDIPTTGMTKEQIREEMYRREVSATLRRISLPRFHEVIDEITPLYPDLKFVTDGEDIYWCDREPCDRGPTATILKFEK